MYFNSICLIIYKLEGNKLLKNNIVVFLKNLF